MEASGGFREGPKRLGIEGPKKTRFREALGGHVGSILEAKTAWKSKKSRFGSGCCAFQDGNGFGSDFHRMLEGLGGAKVAKSDGVFAQNEVRGC